MVTRDANQPKSSWASYAPALKDVRGRWRSRPAGRSCSRWLAPWNPSLPESQNSRSRSATLSTPTPDGPTFRSLFIAEDSWLTAATMLAEIGDCRDRYPSYRALAADAGQSPVAKESGKSHRAQFRWACDHRLREAFNTLADSSRHHNPWAADIYKRARERGAGHSHAARILGRSWSQIIWRLWQDRDTYNPNKHTARQRLAATQD
jgi:hypothetical protein